MNWILVIVLDFIIRVKDRLQEILKNTYK